MGAKTWMIVYSEGNAPEVLKSNPKLEENRTSEFLARLFPDYELSPMDDGSLSFTSPEEDEIYAGFFNGVFVVAATEFGIDYPTKIPEHFITSEFGSTIQLHAMHSAVDWFAFAVWKNNQIKRALSLSPDSGVLEDIGERFEFENPYWEGKHPAIDPEDYDEDEEEYPFPFHPLELGEAALKDMYGYQLEGCIDDPLFEPEEIPLMRFKRIQIKPWWKFW
ncbi:hypothetical protein [uncultured Shewanella sp.]|uniref:DUF6928 family protein n=1 Tax=uncultured Shewanella sp. TaxID=173975 RepID=UPI002613E7A8|nr:hypothetical protein [uncultured Shewanella sp.]